MSILDDIQTYKSLDPTNLRDRLQNFPAQCFEAWENVKRFEIPGEFREVDRVMVLGMGGSAIGGDLIVDLASMERTPQIEVHRDYDTPSYVNKDTLVLACSFSGNTSETISGFRRSRSKGAKLIAITTGGVLGQECLESAIPAFLIKYNAEPRTALGYSFLVPLGILVNLGLISDKDIDLREAYESLRRLSETIGYLSPSQENPAKQLALELHNRLPVIYGGGFFKGVARRWKSQFNENSKIWSLCDELPEAHHNSIAGYDFPPTIKELVTVLMLRPEPMHPALSLRYDVTGELLEAHNIAHRTITADADTPLGQMLTTIFLGDYVSYYLALIQGVDPAPVDPIEFVKDRLMR